MIEEHIRHCATNILGAGEVMFFVGEASKIFLRRRSTGIEPYEKLV